MPPRAGIVADDTALRPDDLARQGLDPEMQTLRYTQKSTVDISKILADMQVGDEV